MHENLYINLLMTILFIGLIIYEIYLSFPII